MEKEVWKQVMEIGEEMTRQAALLKRRAGAWADSAGGEVRRRRLLALAKLHSSNAARCSEVAGSLRGRV